MRGKEIIELDATVTGVIDTRAFRAKLDNGHEFTAFVPRENKSAAGGEIHPGVRIRVCLSSFDMSRGEWIEIVKNEVEDK